MRLSQKYADHSAELTGIILYITGGDGLLSEAAIRLGISAEELTNIGTLRSDFEEAYAAYISPVTHNSISVHAMRVADDNAYTVILPLRQRLKSGLVELTAEDYASLGIHEDKSTRTPVEAPIDVPVPVLVNSAPLNLSFEATEQTTDGVNRTALPKYCKVAREVAILAQGVEPGDGDFHSLDTIGRSRFTITFTAAEVGMDFYLRIAYENSGGRGPLSPPVKAIII